MMLLQHFIENQLPMSAITTDENKSLLFAVILMIQMQPGTSFVHVFRHCFLLSNQ